ncbi:MarR family transcriptional regulator [Natrarchaeobius oligotrophus]|uniref:ArsR family transcriptional regulator n=2 Tax=Natrarchaeobius chitinivorans TaxID=1679083 RepID=A0A3N6MG13_NATCH|nr:helix-turn-helix domain-containing protein [Natrarchaeobius chitinivorans]RQH01908.1 ArsR family transcriptional regulator [Natrarchaeobius chitinivorans]
MSTVRDTENVVRQPAEWMQPVDDRILEIFREHGNLTPAAVEEFGGPSSSHASRRCKKLARHGLLEQIVTGLYTITDDGEAYLDEELDASELEPLEDTE